MMDADEFHALKQDIQLHGQKKPILLYQGKILDGRNRYAACLEVGVDYKTLAYEGKDPISLNVIRRHLSVSQRAMLALKIANYQHGGIRPGQNTLASQAANLPLELSQAKAAKLLNISQRTIRGVFKIMVWKTACNIYHS